ncbi:MAG: CDP-diacylglycerol--glycerol-3-phosphate 3-phosphatidyltransferase [Saccharofermentanales bacterium]|jgi:CDP-diacylglycerol--glycerol-3-phosphate 3-phosphatidyltransferase|nr:CDP-diacylglycerol--glycerol-3-phosphate 3-phosphatidyltransferase [Eubacteriales bacterium]MDD3611001.1 CDP-diacylglycerol--glycerol-3-phosphate 3-phosphatidyltransferase [Eubacteriales bacterium]
MNVPNRLTLLRIFLVPVFLLFMVPIFGDGTFTQFVLSNGGRVIATFIFIIASLTDLLDGLLARRMQLVSNFGKFLDPIADKLLVIAGFAAFVELGRISSFVLIIIVAREFLVTGIRLLAVERGVVIAASWFGKIKAVVQMLTLIFLLIEPFIIDASYSTATFSAGYEIFVNIMIVLTLVLTILSGLDYWYKNRILLRDLTDQI